MAGDATGGGKLPVQAWIRVEDLPPLLAYALLFHLTHSLAAWWGGPGFYSLWFPPAGLRFALLWVFGARLTLAVTTTELLVQLLAGVLKVGEPGWVTISISIARPALAYGAAIWFVRFVTRHRRSPLSTPPMPFGFAAVLAPVAAASAALPWSLLQPEFTGVQSSRDVVASLATFATGDLLGVLLLAPPLIYLAELWLGREEFRWQTPKVSVIVEGGAVLASALLIVWVLADLKIGYSGMPLVLAACWIGLRFGRVAAWLTNAVVAALLFPLTSRVTDIDSRLDLHMAVAAMAMAGYVAASFATASRQSRLEIARRDRLLLQADRLKTLRAMSVAVIHEVSQPLSTLVLETRHLRQSAERGGDPELLETARLVEAKTSALAAMTRRLRDFGSRSDSGTSRVSVERCLAEAVAVVAHETRETPITVELGTDPGIVGANEVELTQAFVNLLRNALQASAADATVRVSSRSEHGHLHLSFENDVHFSLLPGGMGVGSIIARAIIEAAGGVVTQRKPSPYRMITEVVLPLERSRG